MHMTTIDYIHILHIYVCIFYSTCPVSGPAKLYCTVYMAQQKAVTACFSIRLCLPFDLFRVGPWLRVLLFWTLWVACSSSGQGMLFGVTSLLLLWFWCVWCFMLWRMWRMWDSCCSLECRNAERSLECWNDKRSNEHTGTYIRYCWGQDALTL